MQGDDAAAVLERAPELRRSAQRFARVLAPAVRFRWQDGDGGWLAVTLDDGAAHGSEGATTAHLERGPLPHRLTARELDVLTLVACGLANDAIALRLGARPADGLEHVERLLAKLGQTGRRRRCAGRRAGAAAAATARRSSSAA